MTPTAAGPVLGPTLRLRQEEAAPLRSQTRRVQPGDVQAFLARHRGEPRYVYASQAEIVAGAGEAAVLTTQGEQRWRGLRDASRARMDRLRHDAEPAVPAWAAPRWMGAGSFDARPLDPPDPWGLTRFVLPRHLLLERPGEAYETTTLGPGEDAPLPAPRPPGASTPTIRPSDAPPWRAEPGFDAWAASVREALRAIHAGVLEKVVLARSLTTRLPEAPDLGALVARLLRNAASSRVFLVQPCPGRAFVGASPELLVSHDGDRLETHALAGSRPRGQTLEDDEAHERALLSSSKEAWEHEIVCRFLRNALAAREAPWATVSDRRVVRLSNVLHLETRFRSDAVPGEHVLDLVARLHPTPAVAGHPTEAALEYVRGLESSPRGLYAGPVGWFDSEGHGEFSVALRAAAVEDRSVRLYAGCGLVNGSDPAEEWEESRAKFQLLLEAFAAEATT